MALREIVLKELVRRRVAGALRERAAIDAELGLAAPGRAAELQARRAPLAASLEAAMREVASLVPPFEIALRIEAVVARVLALVGGTLGPTLTPALAELEALAGRVEAIWLPGVDLAPLVEVLAEENRPRGASPVAPRTDPRLGWAPIDAEELLALAASELGAITSLQDRARREEHERRQAIERLATARAASGRLAALFGANQEERRQAEARAGELAIESLQASDAFEDLRFVIVRALSVAPPVRLALALRAAAVLGPLAKEDLVLVVGQGGVFERRNLGAQRALFLAALARLRLVCDETFPGLGEIAAGTRGALLDLASAERSASLGPYRGDASHGEEASATEPDAPLTAMLDGSGAAEVVHRGLTHGVMMGFLRPALAGGEEALWTALTRAVRPHDATEPLTVEDRIAYHRQALRPIRHALVTGCADARLPRVLLMEALVQAQGALVALRPVSDGFAVWVQGHGEAIAVVQRLGFVIGAVLGVPPDLWELSRVVAERARGGGPTGSWLVETLARELGATPFPELTQARARLDAHLRHTQQAAWRARAAVPFLDRMNVFFSSDLEEQRDALDAAAEAAQAELDEVSWKTSSWLAEASRRHPVLALPGVAASLWRSTSAIYAMPGGKNSPPTLIGYHQARQHLNELAAMAHTLLGPLPSAAEVLERYVTSRLASRRGFTRG